MKTEDILAQREQTHGSYQDNANISQTLIEIIKDAMGPSWYDMRPYQRHTIMMVCMKLARVAVGNPDEPDHWRDIAGYAELTVRELENEVKTLQEQDDA
jgi:hypothetical protein